MNPMNQCIRLQLPSSLLPKLPPIQVSEVIILSVSVLEYIPLTHTPICEFLDLEPPRPFNTQLANGSLTQTIQIILHVVVYLISFSAKQITKYQKL